MAAVAIGSILIPMLIDAVGIRSALLVTGAFLPLLTAATWRRLVAIDRRTPLRKVEIKLLQEVPMFASLSVGASEYLARNVRVLQVPDSTVLIKEGETGDRFYLVATGRFDVARHGRHLTTQGPGGFFGEMALLRDIPRQATVTASEDSTVYAFERRDFIAAVTGHTLSDRAAQELVEARLLANVRVDDHGSADDHESPED
jgi:Cyclic nucleotide-binding domain